MTGGPYENGRGPVALLLHISSALVCIALRGRMLLWGPEGPMTVGGGPWPPCLVHHWNARPGRDA